MVVIRWTIAQHGIEKFAKKLLGESEIEAVLQRLDRLTHEEGRMTVAQTLEVVHGLVNNVKVVMNGMQLILYWLMSCDLGTVFADGKASMDGIRKALGILLLRSKIARADHNIRYDAANGE